MSELFRMFNILLILNFILFFYSSEVQAVYIFSCTSRDSLPSELFHKNYYNTLSYVKYTSLELGRFIHEELHLDEATQGCQDLLNVPTRIVNYDGTIEDVIILNANEALKHAIDEVYEKAFLMFHNFILNQDLQSIIPYQETRHEYIYRNIDMAIHRLFRSGMIKPNDDILISAIRRMKEKFAFAYQKKGLHINENVVSEAPSTTELLYIMNPGIGRDATTFVAQTANTPVTGTDGSILYIGQSEMAATLSADASVTIIGSDGASTSIIVVLKHARSKAYGVAHIDLNENTHTALLELANLVVQLAGDRYDNKGLHLHLIGGYLDPDGLGDDIFLNIMDAFHTQSIPIFLRSACVGSFNTTVLEDGTTVPKVTGVVIHLRSGQIRPGTFLEPVPDQELRIARLLAGDRRILNIYNFGLKFMTIGPFFYNSSLLNVQEILQMTDEQLQGLRIPPSNLVPDLNCVRQALNFLLEYPDSTKSFVIDEAKATINPHFFMRDNNNKWVPVPSS